MVVLAERQRGVIEVGATENTLVERVTCDLKSCKRQFGGAEFYICKVRRILLFLEDFHKKV